MPFLSWHEAFPSLNIAHPDNFPWDVWRNELSATFDYNCNRAWHFGEPADLFCAFCDATFAQVRCTAPDVNDDAISLALALPGDVPNDVKFYTLRYALRQVNKRTEPHFFNAITLPPLPRANGVKAPVFSNALVEIINAQLCQEATQCVLTAVRSVVRQDSPYKFRVIIPREVDIEAVHAAVKIASHNLARAELVHVTPAHHVAEDAFELHAHIIPNADN